MKKSITTIALALFAILSTQAATSFGFSEIDSDSIVLSPKNKAVVQQKYAAEEISVPNPWVYISSNYSKPVEQLIADNNEMTESKVASETVKPLYFEVPKRVIRANNQIIAADVQPYAPLDFDYIRRVGKMELPLALPQS